jgi:hypothetical protein
MRSVATFLRLVTTSLVCLCAGALLAVTFEGLFRPASAAAGFFGYVYFFAHALKEFELSSVPVEDRPGPDGEVRREPDQIHVLTAAA